MPESPRFFQPLAAGVRELARRAPDSQRLGRLMNTPPVAWSVRTLTRAFVSQQVPGAGERYVANERTTRGNLHSTLQAIVDDVVEALGYSVAMLALYEEGDVLTILAIQYDRRVLSTEQLQGWEQQISHAIGRPVSLTNPDVARTFVYRDEYADNLSVKAARRQKPVISNTLFDLFTPITPEFTRPIIEGIQQELGLKQMIAMPFFLETDLDGTLTREMVGNLFAVSSKLITDADITVLSAFGRQAAAALLSERQRIQIELAQELVYNIQNSLQDEDQLWRYIAEGVVAYLGFPAAMVGPYEADGTLLLRACSFEPGMITAEKIQRWETQIARLNPAKPAISLRDPQVAQVHGNHPDYQANLGVQAVQTGHYVVSNELYTLFTPVVPPAARPVIAAIQQELGIHQVIALPFFRETRVNGQLRREPVGNLVAVTRSRSFRIGEIQLLQAFGQQAAIGLHNARLYRQAEDRRTAAQMFGRMAFSASASVHTLKNHIGAIRLPLQLINMALKTPDVFPETERRQLLASLENDSDVFRHLNNAADLLDHLHEPWRHMSDVQTDVNTCLDRALNRLLTNNPDWLETELAADLPALYTAPEMLTEAFKVLIKNALEALHEIQAVRQPRLQVRSACTAAANVQVIISDNGIGIRPENLQRIFEMRYTTKSSGLGFGLFWTRDYIEGLGGRLTAESIWQQGTTFTITLPAVHDDQGATQAEASLAKARGEPYDDQTARHFDR